MPNATLGMLWPSIRIDFRQPVGALGVVLVASVGASAVSGGDVLAVVAVMVVGLAAAPIFPLLALTTGARAGARVVSWQVAASSVGGAVLPAGVGLAVGASHVTVLGPLLLVLSGADVRGLRGGRLLHCGPPACCVTLATSSGEVPSRGWQCCGRLLR